MLQKGAATNAGCLLEVILSRVAEIQGCNMMYFGPIIREKRIISGHHRSEIPCVEPNAKEKKLQITANCLVNDAGKLAL